MINQYINLNNRYFLLLIIFFSTGCSQIGLQFSGINMYSTREELELGYRYSIQLEKQLNINNDPVLNQYINFWDSDW